MNRRHVLGLVGASVLVGCSGRNGDGRNSEPTPTATPTETPTEKERVKQAIRNADYVSSAEIDQIKQVRIQELSDAEGTVISVRARPDQYFDAVDIARTGTMNAFVVCRALYTSIDGVAEVHVFTLAAFTDKYGNTEEEPAVTVHLNKETAEKIDWQGIQQRVELDYKNFLRVADGYKIHLAVCKELDEVYPNCAK